MSNPIGVTSKGAQIQSIEIEKNDQGADTEVKRIRVTAQDGRTYTIRYNTNLSKSDLASNQEFKDRIDNMLSKQQAISDSYAGSHGGKKVSLIDSPSGETRVFVHYTKQVRNADNSVKHNVGETKEYTTLAERKDDITTHLANLPQPSTKKENYERKLDAIRSLEAKILQPTNQSATLQAIPVHDQLKDFLTKNPAYLIPMDKVFGDKSYMDHAFQNLATFGIFLNPSNQYVLVRYDNTQGRLYPAVIQTGTNAPPLQQQFDDHYREVLQKHQQAAQGPQPQPQPVPPPQPQPQPLISPPPTQNHPQPNHTTGVNYQQKFDGACKALLNPHEQIAGMDRQIFQQKLRQLGPRNQMNFSHSYFQPNDSHACVLLRVNNLVIKHTFPLDVDQNTGQVSPEQVQKQVSDRVEYMVKNISRGRLPNSIGEDFGEIPQAGGHIPSPAPPPLSQPSGSSPQPVQNLVNPGVSPQSYSPIPGLTLRQNQDEALQRLRASNPFLAKSSMSEDDFKARLKEGKVSLVDRSYWPDGAGASVIYALSNGQYYQAKIDVPPEKLFEEKPDLAELAQNDFKKYEPLVAPPKVTPTSAGPIPPPPFIQPVTNPFVQPPRSAPLGTFAGPRPTGVQPNQPQVSAEHFLTNVYPRAQNEHEALNQLFPPKTAPSGTLPLLEEIDQSHPEFLNPDTKVQNASYWMDDAKGQLHIYYQVGQGNKFVKDTLNVIGPHTPEQIQSSIKTNLNILKRTPQPNASYAGATTSPTPPIGGGIEGAVPIPIPGVNTPDQASRTSYFDQPGPNPVVRPVPPPSGSVQPNLGAQAGQLQNQARKERTPPTSPLPSPPPGFKTADNRAPNASDTSRPQERRTPSPEERRTPSPAKEATVAGVRPQPTVANVQTTATSTAKAPQNLINDVLDFCRQGKNIDLSTLLRGREDIQDITDAVLETGNLDMIRVYLSTPEGRDDIQRTDIENSYLIRAIRSGNAPVVKLLVDHGAYIDPPALQFAKSKPEISNIVNEAHDKMMEQARADFAKTKKAEEAKVAAEPPPTLNSLKPNFERFGFGKVLDDPTKYQEEYDKAPVGTFIIWESHSEPGKAVLVMKMPNQTFAQAQQYREPIDRNLYGKFNRIIEKDLLPVRSKIQSDLENAKRAQERTTYEDQFRKDPNFVAGTRAEARAKLEQTKNPNLFNINYQGGDFYLNYLTADGKAHSRMIISDNENKTFDLAKEVSRFNKTGYGLNAKSFKELHDQIRQQSTMETGRTPSPSRDTTTGDDTTVAQPEAKAAATESREASDAKVAEAKTTTATPTTRGSPLQYAEMDIEDADFAERKVSDDEVTRNNIRTSLKRDPELGSSFGTSLTSVYAMKKIDVKEAAQLQAIGIDELTKKIASSEKTSQGTSLIVTDFMIFPDENDPKKMNIQFRAGKYIAQETVTIDNEYEPAKSLKPVIDKVMALRSTPPTNEQLDKLPNFAKGGLDEVKRELAKKGIPTELSTADKKMALADFFSRFGEGAKFDPNSFRVFSTPNPPYLSVALIRNEIYVVLPFELLPGDDPKTKVENFVNSLIPEGFKQQAGA